VGLVQMNGWGFSFHAVTHVRMSFSNRGRTRAGNLRWVLNGYIPAN
jgi:hypothetical protein